jgi:hypothetical protein
MEYIRGGDIFGVPSDTNMVHLGGVRIGRNMELIRRGGGLPHYIWNIV